MPGPFDLDDESAYRDWREEKLSAFSAQVKVVELRNPKNLTEGERGALLERCARTNIAVYKSSCVDEDKDIPRLLGLQLGLARLDGNYLADDDGISPLAVAARGTSAAGGRGGVLGGRGLSAGRR